MGHTVFLIRNYFDDPNTDYMETVRNFRMNRAAMMVTGTSLFLYLPVQRLITT